MRPASDSILSAVERTDLHEDRLTEILACVAQVNARFADALVRMAGVRPQQLAPLRFAREAEASVTRLRLWQ